MNKKQFHIKAQCPDCNHVWQGWIFWESSDFWEKCSHCKKLIHYIVIEVIEEQF